MNNNYTETGSIHQKVETGAIEIDDQVSLVYKVIGDSQDHIVVLHGGPGLTSNYLIPDLMNLSLRWKLIFYDQRGSGFSPPIYNEKLVTIEHFIEDLEKVRQYFGIEKLNLLGHSWGGELAGYYANRYPGNINRIIMIDPSCPDKDIMEPTDFTKSLTDDQKRSVNYHRKRFLEKNSRKKSADFWSVYIKGYYSRHVDSRNMWGDVTNVLHEYYEGKNTSVMSTMFKQLSQGTMHLVSNLDKLESPVLIIHGEDDPIPIEAAKLWDTHITNSKLIILPNTGHFPYIEKSELTLKLISEFMSGNWPNEASLNSDGEHEILIAEDSDPFKSLYSQIHRRSQRFAAHVNSQEWSKVADLFTEDGTTYPPGSPPIAGKSGVAMLWEALYQKGLRELNLQTMEVEGFGDLCFEIGKYKIFGDNVEVLDIGKFIVIWKLVNGEWKLYRDIFNSSLETRSMLEIPDYLFPPAGTLQDE